jgi:hypothetical protein
MLGGGVAGNFCKNNLGGMVSMYVRYGLLFYQTIVGVNYCAEAFSLQ